MAKKEIEFLKILGRGGWDTEERKYRVLRGGGFWHTVAFFNRARARYFLENGRHEYGVGFRCAWDHNAFPDYSLSLDE